MKSFIIVGFLLYLTAVGESMVQNSSLNQELIVCGWDEVFILDFSKPNQEQPTKIWSWKAAERSDLPDEFKGLFGTTDECKPFNMGKNVLITSSGGAVAYVDRQQDRVLFYARAANAHSADLLPNNRVAVAASFNREGRGDRLIIFDLNQPDQALWHEELPGGHGVVWDEERQLLWALSIQDIRVYQLDDWDTSAPKLINALTIDLPERGGHDLYPVPGTSLLMVTTGKHCWLFDRDKKTFTLHPELSEQAHVKSISQHPITKQVVYVQAEGDHWWAERLHFLNPEQTLHIPGEHFYKARWNIQVK
jgi:hypothetical protein